ncbi:hypothetical protein HBB16_07205 [Pseudonocardia sp. MCCB 268]|nr:hypothetical protein [Pseudonocardia cytotoxica]
MLLLSKVAIPAIPWLLSILFSIVIGNGDRLRDRHGGLSRRSPLARFSRCRPRSRLVSRCSTSRRSSRCSSSCW